MGNKEFNELFDYDKNKYRDTSLVVHWAWFPVFLIWMLFEWLFSPNFERWPKILVDLISTAFRAYVQTAVMFGLLKLLFTYLGIITRKDFMVYFSFFLVNIIYFFLTSLIIKLFPEFGIKLHLEFGPNLKFYGPIMFWLIILITSFMNRINRLSEKINEIHEKLNNKI